MALRDVLKRISKVKSTILSDIWVEILFFTLVATGEYSSFISCTVAEMSRRPPVVTMVTTFTSRDLSFNNQLMTVLGTALGFVISFRTSTAYERSVCILPLCLCAHAVYSFAEGRQLWTTIAITSRTLAQTVRFTWIT